MVYGARKQTPQAVFAIMGATGTGKSTFVHLLTNDDTIHIGHNQDSETFGIQPANYIDQTTGRDVMLIDTPGFDDSREGITDTDILQKIVEYLEPERGMSRKLNGIIYMHRISDPRVGGVSRKNLRMFYSICGEKTLANVRIVTTNWGRVTEQEGSYREADLMNSAFKPLIDAGAQMCRHANTVESASQIMSKLLPLEAVTTAIQEEAQAGMTLGRTSAGRILMGETEEVQRKHEREMADLKEESEKAARESNQALRAELEHERMALEEKIKRVEADRAKLEKTLKEIREAGQRERAEEKAKLAQLEKQWTDEHRILSAEMAATRESAARLGNEAAKRQEEFERRMMNGNSKSRFEPERPRPNANRGGYSGARTEPRWNQELEPNNVGLDPTGRNAPAQSWSREFPRAYAEPQWNRWLERNDVGLDMTGQNVPAQFLSRGFSSTPGVPQWNQGLAQDGVGPDMAGRDASAQFWSGGFSGTPAEPQWNQGLTKDGFWPDMTGRNAPSSGLSGAPAVPQWNQQWTQDNVGLGMTGHNAPAQPWSGGRPAVPQWNQQWERNNVGSDPTGYHAQPQSWSGGFSGAQWNQGMQPVVYPPATMGRAKETILRTVVRVGERCRSILEGGY